MSVDYYSCEWCGDAIYEEDCRSRSIGDEEIRVCNWCLEEHEEKGLLISLTDDDDEFENYPPEIREKIEWYGAHYQWTKTGIETEIEDIENDIQELQCRKSDLQKRLCEVD